MIEPWIQTFSGLKFDYKNINPDTIRIEDIAHHLANICRYTGAKKNHYSVAQHSVLVSMILPPGLALSGLMHDSAEAYTGDMNKPLKDFLGCKKLEKLEHDLTIAIYDKFCIWPYHFESPGVKESDLMLLRAEAWQLLKDPPIGDWHKHLPQKLIYIEPWSAEHAEAAFLDMFEQLGGGFVTG